MRTLVRRMISIIMSVITVLSCFAGLTFSVGAETSGDYEYEVLDDGTVSITKYNGDDTIVSIPSKIDGKNVTEIGDKAFSSWWAQNIKEITIPNSVTTICDYAFDDCTGLTSIIIPDSVTTIGNYAFQECT